MTIDWVTWSIWLVGFAILILWIFVPIREFRRLMAARKEEAQTQPAAPDETSEQRNPR